MREAVIPLALVIVGCQSTTSGPDAAIASCDSIPQRAQDLTAQLAACTPDAGGCKATIKGICCPITVSDPTAPGVMELESIVGAFVATCSPYICVGPPCPDAATGVCTTETGECAQ